mmetsp:Transcript_4038/g.7152  ORF Transcript_4038/g.7152 Transcript_4038/m.7152 type:complete len:395 (-) Transcript_4038:60-1244(-)
MLAMISSIVAAVLLQQLQIVPSSGAPTDENAELCMLQLRSNAVKAEHESVQHTLNRNLTITDQLDSGNKSRYLMILKAAEQFEGAMDFVTDALHFAKMQQRIFVEPVLSHGRLVDPFIEDDWIPLSMLVDKAALQEYYGNWIDAEDFLNLFGGRGSAQKPSNAVLEPLVAESGDGQIHHLDDSTIKKFESRWDVSVLGLTGSWWRLSKDEDIRYSTTMTTRGVKKKPSPYVAELAARAMKGWSGQIVCALWRSEKHEIRNDCSLLEECADDFVRAVKSVQEREHVRHVLLLSDILPNTSDTYHENCSASRTKLTRHFNQEMDIASLNGRFEAIRDNALRAQVEAQVCAKSTAMLGCPLHNPGPRCGTCARTSSKFHSKIMKFRQEYALPDVVTW